MYTCLHDYLQALLFFTVVRATCAVVVRDHHGNMSYVVRDNTYYGNQCCNGGCIQEVCSSIVAEVWQGTVCQSSSLCEMNEF